MATFKFGRAIDLHWQGYEIVGPAETVFSIPDQLYEEFNDDIAPVEPTLVWLDTNEFLTLTNTVSTATLSASLPIALTTTTSGKTISLSSTTALNGYLLAADGTGGTIWTPASTSSLTSVIGVSPISAVISGGTVSVSLAANYQTAGIYVTSVTGTSPISATGTTAITVSVNQASLSVANATTAEGLRTYVKNTSGSAMTKGQAVYISGADGTNVTISLSSASTEATSSKTLGLLAQDLANNAFGWVVENGYLGTIDTSAATAGQTVWLGNTPGSRVYGAPPAEPSHAVYLGVVARSNANNGEIIVKVQNGYELDELHDVFVGGVSTALPLVYSSTSSGWVAQALTSVGIADNAIVAAKIAAGAVGSAAIGVGAVVAGDIAANAVTSGNIAAGAVGTAALSSGAAANGTILTANGSGGATFASAPAGGGYYVTGTSLVNGSNLTSMATGPYLVSNPDSTSIEVIRSSGTTSTVAQYAYVYSSDRTSTSTRFPVMSSWITSSVNTSTASCFTRFLNGQFWIFGTVSTAASAGLHRSIDSSSWTNVTSGLANSDIIQDMAYNGSNLYVLCGRDSGGNVGKVSTSPGTSGSTWTARSINANMFNCTGVVSSGSRWVVVGNGSASDGQVLTSTDGTTWSSNSPGSFALTAVAFGVSTFVAVGDSGKIYTSPSTSGSVWTLRTSGVATLINDVTYANGIFAACTASAILSSSDGITWTSANAGVAINQIEYVTFTNNGSMWVGTYGSNGWARSLNTPPSSFTTGTSGNTSMGVSISYNSNTLIATNNFGRFNRATETNSFNSVWNPVTGVSA